MKKLYLLVVTGLLFTSNSLAKVTIADPTHTTPNLTFTYTSLVNHYTLNAGYLFLSKGFIINQRLKNTKTRP